MRAYGYELGTKFRHTELNTILEVVEIDREKLFKEQKYGDLHEWIDESLFDEVYEA